MASKHHVLAAILARKKNVFNEISGAEPTALFQEEEITVKKPQEDVKIMF